jgi:hypothetical protein
MRVIVFSYFALLVTRAGRLILAYPITNFSIAAAMPADFDSTEFL